MDEWSKDELGASVKAYRHMQQMEAGRKKYSKVEQYRVLATRFPTRTAKAFEYRMQNISSILHEQGNSWISGLKPAGNIGANMKPQIEALLRDHPFREPQGNIAAYKVKLPAMRDWLIRVAQAGCSVSYIEMREVFDIDRFSHGHAMDYLGHQSANLDEPILTALVVGMKSRRCSKGFAEEFGVHDDVGERAKLYEYWAEREPNVTPLAASPTFEERVSRFVSVEIRPDQALFRRRVYSACRGQCVVSGCDVVTALDAAHRSGRSWRRGHNSANDGYILRKDLHALYDATLLKIEDDGSVWIDPRIIGQYGMFAGLKVSL